APNVAPDPRDQGHFYSPGVGSADRWKIAFAYTADPQEAERLARLAETDGRTYGSDEDNSGSGAMDPTVNTYDLSADPLAWGRERTALVARLWERLDETVLTDNSRYADLTAAFRSLLGQYGQALAPAVKYIGGSYVYRTRPGDPADRGPFVPIDRAVQLDALRFLSERAFGQDAFELPRETLARFGPQRWNHWGYSNTYDGRIDFPFHEEIAQVQARYLTQLLNPYRLARMRDMELRHGADNVLSIPELMSELTRAIWAELWQTQGGSIDAQRRDLQRAHLERVTALVVAPPERLPGDARAVARAQLRDLDRRIAAALQRPGTTDAYTRAHLAESRDLIDRALDAGLQLQLSGAGGS
ncbi:MAG TPA: zinc-dependent metalloprotease, partial [Longimicrobiales bacterium]